MRGDKEFEVMRWNRLLCVDEYDIHSRDDKGRWHRSVELSQPEDDYQRVITSSIVRALQDKTQMLAMDSSAQVRTRLTHSIEVAAIARRFIPAVSSILKSWCRNRKRKTGHFLEDYFVDASRKVDAMRQTLETAGLLHDLGNPPFGHDGEKCLSEQVAKWCEEHDGILTNDEGKDLGNVEGNSQALRFLINPNPVMDIGLADLTPALLASMTKYTVSSKDWIEAYRDSEVVWRHKPGYYLSEREACVGIGQALGLIQNDDAPHEYCRHPLAYLLEASDDIAYLTADLEDAYAMGLVTDEHIAEMWNQLRKCYENDGEFEDNARLKKSGENIKTLVKELDQHDKDDFDGKLLYINTWIFQMRDSLVYAAAQGFCWHLEEIMKGEYHGELLADAGLSKYVVRVLRTTMEENVYKNGRVRRQRNVGKDALRFLFGKFAGCIDDDTGKIDLTRELSIPHTFRSYLESTAMRLDDADGLKDGLSPAYHAMRTVLDYICSLTDRRVLELRDAYQDYDYDRLAAM